MRRGKTTGKPETGLLPPLLLMEGIEKSFPGVKAVRNGHFELRGGEVHSLIGENGAGKSTLIKILSGVHQPDTGMITLDGESVRIYSPLDAVRRGISVIYQEFNLVPKLQVSENVFLGKEKGKFGFVTRSTENRETEKLLKLLGVVIRAEAMCENLSLAEQQAVEIAKSLVSKAKIIAMDEPTAALTPREVQKLFSLIGNLKRKGIAVIYITHRLEEVFEIADRVTVMRDGEWVGTFNTKKVTRNRLIELMVGRSIENEFPRLKIKAGEVKLDVKNLTRKNAVNDVTFSVKKGEVLGITGLAGSGRTETIRLIFGADRRDSGEILIDGKVVEINSPRDAIKAGISLLTEDRKGQGLILNLSARENFGLPNLRTWSRAGFLNVKKERKSFARYIESLKIRVVNQEQPAKNLSGGNQQKVVLAKWLQSNSEIIIFDEPTRGIDVGAKFEIYNLINELKKNGKAIIMISSDFPEVLGISDRIVVMHSGRISGEITDVPEAIQEDIMRLSISANRKGETGKGVIKGE